MKPKIAAFPKGWIRDLVAPDKLSIYEWIDMSQAMGIQGLEMYNNFADFKDEANWPKIRKYVESTGMVVELLAVVSTDIELSTSIATTSDGDDPHEATTKSMETVKPGRRNFDRRDSTTKD